MDVEARVKNIIAEVLNMEADSISMDASFFDELSADSLDLFQIITSIEDEFGVTIEDEDVESIKTVRDAVEKIEKNI